MPRGSGVNVGREGGRCAIPAGVPGGGNRHEIKVAWEGIGMCLVEATGLRGTGVPCVGN